MTNFQKFQTESRALSSSTRFKNAKEELLLAIEEISSRITDVRPPKTPEQTQEYEKLIQKFILNRGRELFFPYLSSGMGSGALVELEDGSVKFDMISGIGINFFGHCNSKLIAEAIDSLTSDVMQGNLQPGFEAQGLLDALLFRAAKGGSKLKHGWLHCSGTMANETALKIVRQKKFPATRIFAFEDCFAGRSTAMQEITDNPKYREGQPLYGEVTYLPFYDEKIGLRASVNRAKTIIESHLIRFPSKYAALMIELIQGEGGFKYAPQEYYEELFEVVKKHGLFVWVDEIQTFGRTGELFAYQLFNLEKYVDVVTVGKLLHACAVLYTEELNPKPGLLAGTFTGSSVALRTGRKILELLDEGKFFGPTGKIAQLSKGFEENLHKLATGSCVGLISERRIIGGMIGFKVLSGTLEDTKAFLMKLYEKGVVAFYCGHSPYFVRMLPPLGAMSIQDVDKVCKCIEKTALEMSK